MNAISGSRGVAHARPAPTFPSDIDLSLADDDPIRRDLPSGTVTFVFTDVEASTKLLHELGDVGYAKALARHRRVVRDACAAHGGVEVDNQGDAFFLAFPTAPEALGAARLITAGLEFGPIRVRMGLHTGTPLTTEEGYVGEHVHFAARVAASGHGGQVVLSKATRELLDESIPLSDLGEHRLKDIEGPVWIFQLGEDHFPPLKTISNTNLPRPASSFVGREQELEDVVARIGNGARLLTLTGPGGSGKTRLAIEAAASIVTEYRNGVFWVGLATLREPTLVLDTVAQTLGAKVGLAEYISEREMLILVDNLEQVIESAPELSAVLASCPNLTLLVTSRELLRVQGEVEYAVPPFADKEAVALFCERAQVEPTDEIRALCARLDNLPLAIELAAARVKALSPGQILERVSQRLDLLKGGRDADPRQQTLRTTIEWSYDLLSAGEQTLFCRLSVFGGGCTLEAAEEIANADLDTMQALVEKSLLRYSEERYWMLETIREYAAGRLDGRGESDELRQRHATHFLEVAETKAARKTFELHFDQLKREHDNLRNAIETFRRTTDSDAELRLAASLGRFWHRGGYLREGLTCLEEALSGANDGLWELKCGAHGFASAIASAQGNPEGAEIHARAQLEIARARGGAKEVAAALLALGCSAEVRGEFGEARHHLEEALVLARESDHGQVAAVIGNLAEVTLSEGDFDRAVELAVEEIELSRAQGWDIGVAVGFVTFALARLRQGRVADASAAIREAAEIITAHEFGITAYWLEAAGATLSAQGNVGAATKLLGAAAAAREEIGAELSPVEAGLHVTVVERLRRILDDDFENAWAEGAAMTKADAVTRALESLD
jgi:predicted ATPase/class 3 adenylate cyclase